VERWVETQRQLWAEQRLSQAQLRYMSFLGGYPMTAQGSFYHLS
jgi:hypothetical protein